MLGAIIGDIIGSVYEFDNRLTTEFPLFKRGCFPTDDSIMSIAVADGIIRAWGAKDDDMRASIVSSMQHIGRKYPHCGFGGNFRRWIKSDHPQPYGSYGNGSGMRVSSVAWLFNDLETVLHMAELTADVTHNHPEGIKGAKAIAGATFLARKGASKEQIRDFVVKEIGYDLSRSLDEIRPGYGFYETCQKSVPESIQAFLEGDSYESTIRLAISIGGDSDTIACMAGAIAEAYYGIPESIKKEALSYMDSYLTGKVKKYHSFYRQLQKIS